MLLITTIWAIWNQGNQAWKHSALCACEFMISALNIMKLNVKEKHCSTSMVACLFWGLKVHIVCLAVLLHVFRIINVLVCWMLWHTSLLCYAWHKGLFEGDFFPLMNVMNQVSLIDLGNIKDASRTLHSNEKISQLWPFSHKRAAGQWVVAHR